MPDAERAGYHADLRELGYRVFKCEEFEYRGEELGPGDLTPVEALRHFRDPERVGVISK